MQQRSPISPSAAAARNQRLSVIAEDGTPAPPIPPRVSRRDRASDSSSAFTLPLQGTTPTTTTPQYNNSGVQTSHRPNGRRWTDKPPHHSAEASPPGYQHWDDSQPPPKWRMFLEKIRGNPEIARRGGWKRLVILLAILLAVIIALAVGLGVGLSRRNSSSSENSNNAGNQTQPFPIGSYTIPVYSTQATTDCTSISTTWRCYPYSLYSSSNPSLSSATYNWIVTAGDTQNPPRSFNISTSPNPFADMFSNIPLTLSNAGTPNEYWGFSLPMVKSVVPTTSIAANGQTTTCYYNSTVFSAQLYTRRQGLNISTTTGAQQSTNSGSNPAAGSSIGSSSSSIAPVTNWIPWPGAVNVTQSANGGADVPNCYAMGSDGRTGQRVTSGLAQQPVERSCVCGYRNFDV